MEKDSLLNLGPCQVWIGPKLMGTAKNIRVEIKEVVPGEIEQLLKAHKITLWRSLEVIGKWT